MKITEKDIVPGAFLVMNDKGNFFIGEIRGISYTNEIITGIKGGLIDVLWTYDVDKSFTSDYHTKTIIRYIERGTWTFVKNEKSVLVAKIKLSEKEI